MATRPRVTRGALTGAVVSAAFGVAWALWGASGLSGALAWIVGVLGALLGIGVVVAALRLRVDAGPDDESMFGSRPYQLIVLAEFAALIMGTVVLGSSGHNEYVPVWYATVVGVHFLAFGRMFWRGFAAIGAAMLVAALAGLVVGLAGAADARIAATTGLLAAAVLLTAAMLVTRRG